MIDNILDKIKDNKKIVFLPKSEIEYIDSFKYMYGDNIIIIEDSMGMDYLPIVDAINNSKIEEAYFVNFVNIYRKIMPEIKKQVTIYDIFLISVCNLTNSFILQVFYDVFEFYSRKLISKIFVLDSNMYEILNKANYRVEMLNIKLPFDAKSINIKNKNSKSIGILSNDYDPIHNFYNMLTSIRLVDDYDKVKLIANMATTKNFFNHFDINYELCDSINDVIKDNFVNLYCNFSNTNPIIILKSMDMGIPCIVGNTDIFSDNKVLNELLVLKSDDDVNEIADKINNIKANYDKIFKEYKKWRKTKKFDKNF